MKCHLHWIFSRVSGMFWLWSLTTDLGTGYILISYLHLKGRMVCCLNLKTYIFVSSIFVLYWCSFSPLYLDLMQEKVLMVGGKPLGSTMSDANYFLVISSYDAIHFFCCFSFWLNIVEFFHLYKLQSQLIQYYYYYYYYVF